MILNHFGRDLTSINAKIGFRAGLKMKHSSWILALRPFESVLIWLKDRTGTSSNGQHRNGRIANARVADVQRNHHRAAELVIDEIYAFFNS